MDLESSVQPQRVIRSSIRSCERAGAAVRASQRGMAWSGCGRMPFAYWQHPAGFPADFGNAKVRSLRLSLDEPQDNPPGGGCV